MFYFSVYRTGASDASFTSHYVNIVDAVSTSSSSLRTSSGRTTSHTSTTLTKSTSTNTATSTSVSISRTPSPTAPAGPPQELSRGIIAGIALGSTLGTLCSVAIAGWCVWKAVKRRRTQAFTTEGAGRQQRRGSIWKGLWNRPSRGSSPYEPYELSNNQIVELDSSPRSQNSYGR